MENPAGALQAGHVALTGRRRIGAAELVEVGMVEARRFDRDQDLPGSGDRVGEVSETRDGLACVGEWEDRPHASSGSLSGPLLPALARPAWGFRS
jgi:hypothetical protein